MAGLPSCCSATDMTGLLKTVAVVLSPGASCRKTRFFMTQRPSVPSLVARSLDKCGNAIRGEHAPLGRSVRSGDAAVALLPPPYRRRDPVGRAGAGADRR